MTVIIEFWNCTAQRALTDTLWCSEGSFYEEDLKQNFRVHRHSCTHY